MRIRTLIVCIGAAGLLAAPRSALADPPESPSHVCGAIDGVLPPNIDLSKLLAARVSTMLQRSPTFREQCRRIADAPEMRVKVRPDLRFVDLHALKASTIFRRPAPGVVEAVVTLHPVADAALWLSHELEHVIEQIEHADLADMTKKGEGAWHAAQDVYETDRAVRAGLTVQTEVRDNRNDERRAE